MTNNHQKNLMEKIVSLAKRRGFIYQSSEIYGGLSNSWDYGPLGTELKNNIKRLWWWFFVLKRDNIYPLDSQIILKRSVWQASGHEKQFNDLLSECRKCKNRFRSDKLPDPERCPICNFKLSEPRQFNTMMKTFIGPVEGEAGLTYLRPETAQGMFINFKNIIDSFHPKIPFGLAQIGKAFRNEITPSNFIFRTREFEQMEIEFFIKESEWEKWFNFWFKEMKKWLKLIGISEKNLYFHEIDQKERAHYSKRTIDIEYKFPFSQEELYGLAYRTDYDLKNHSQESGIDLVYTEDGNSFIPHVIEPTFGVERTVLAVLSEAYYEEEIAQNKNEKRVVLKLNPLLSPIKVAIFPLLANKKELVEKAKDIYSQLLKIENQIELGGNFTVAFDDIGNIGKRYRRQDEIGTPWCLTVDFETLKNNTLTIRDRDTLSQERIKIEEIIPYLKDKFIKLLKI